MAKFNCAISGLVFDIPNFSTLLIPKSRGYFHPIFSISRLELESIYYQHCKGELTNTESYLLFLALLHSSDKIHWNTSAKLKPNDPLTLKLIENNIKQLITVLNQTDTIHHPIFKQPEYSVTADTCLLTSIPNWIKAWEDNIYNYRLGIASMIEKEEMQKIENKLTDRILSGDSPAKYSALIANWADKAAEFPPDKKEQYKEIIRTCFNPNKMFNTPLSTIKEVEDYCYNNIEAGSIHFHELCEALNTGIKNHVDYLGMATPASNFTLLPNIDKLTDDDCQIINQSTSDSMRASLDKLRAALAAKKGVIK